MLLSGISNLVLAWPAWKDWQSWNFFASSCQSIQDRSQIIPLCVLPPGWPDTFQTLPDNTTGNWCQRKYYILYQHLTTETQMVNNYTIETVTVLWPSTSKLPPLEHCPMIPSLALGKLGHASAFCYNLILIIWDKDMLGYWGCCSHQQWSTSMVLWLLRAKGLYDVYEVVLCGQGG